MNIDGSRNLLQQKFFTLMQRLSTDAEHRQNRCQLQTLCKISNRQKTFATKLSHAPDSV